MFEKELQKRIDEAIQAFVAERWKVHIAELEREKERYIAGMCINLCRQVNIDTVGDRITISIKQEK